ncbi:hypothetical protein C3K47_05160 [Solitalea longa]|uniref:Peptidase S9 prolyl oligopeptidase catalytic domain-containing protein n=1 Tax=Solitalea longa TaxID=2079460 RepID=A0A2S5A6J6_9SPHI|nr:prolyl oligopeptidase family serine peptidase [Solitalea longa]POY37917.1 hypothetical protein C3K47_05160 [Solitalea longa]
MKKITILFILFLCGNYGFAQKPALDYSVIDNWTTVNTSRISNDGKYAFYSAIASPFRGSVKDRCIIKQINGNWEKSFPTRSFAEFTSDSRIALLQQTDSLCLIKLGTSSVEYITSVLMYKLFTLDKQQYVVIRKSNMEKEILLRNLTTGKQQSFTGITDFMVSPAGDKLLLRTPGPKDSGQEELTWVNLRSGKKVVIFKGTAPANYVFNKAEDKLAFSVYEIAGGALAHAFYIYTADKGAVKVVANQSPGIETGETIERITNFSKDDSRLFFTMKSKPGPPASEAKGVKVDVWNYRDLKLQTVQLLESGPLPLWMQYSSIPESKAVVTLATGRVVRLEIPGDKSHLFPDELMENYVFPYTAEGDISESFWNKGVTKVQYKVDTRTGERTKVDLDLLSIRGISPGGKYMMATNKGGDKFFSIDQVTGKTVHINANVPLLAIDEDFDGVGPKPHEQLGFIAWTENDASALLYDKYDIWKLDLTGKKPPVNVTGGYGRRNKIVLRLVEDDPKKAIKETEPILLCAFNTETKDNGFYTLQLNKPGNPALLTMGPYLYYSPYIAGGDKPVKAKDANVWIVKRQSASQSANFFTTSDFKKFTPLSKEYPEKKYNWLTSDLMSWKDANGRDMKGVLYKPENFDPAKKYPVIFNYYEKLSDRKNVYHQAEMAMDNINIPWFVSHGYLVYTPDIHYTVGEPGNSALKALIGSAKMLSALPYVDAAKMGIQGHSFGGYETNYIVSHTNIFAAAMSASGVSDAVSAYNYIWDTGSSNQQHEETGQGRMGGNLWDIQDKYLENSAVLSADKVTTPLLMMHNKADGGVPFTQSLELFLSLRRLGKRAWLLQYDGHAHSIIGEATKDYTQRMDQFFDHYLKGAPAPKWMLQGIPASQKGIDSGLELSTEIDENGKPVTPGKGLLIDKIIQ